ncbi:MAG: hypothetical protein EOO86_04090 [Pedobacter sp.]|nr:MAG: hypothetical protein EOO86_04090 [Pedobacter sp.]
MLFPSIPLLTAVNLTSPESGAEIAETKAETSVFDVIAALNESAETDGVPSGMPSVPPNLKLMPAIEME